MAHRYEHTKIKKSNVIRGEANPNPYNDVKSNRTTLYSSVPETDDDIYLITQRGDRLDTLAYQYYGDPGLWWYIAKANYLNFIVVPDGTSLRIPGSKQNAIGI